MLELHDAHDAFEALEAYLADEGFWGRDDVVADLFLGYRLSDPLRRERGAAPPEPCPLPALACRIRPAREEPARDAGYTLGEWERTWSDDDYADAIDAVRAAIARGDVYQVNLVQHLSAPFAGDPAGSRRRSRRSVRSTRGRSPATAGRSSRPRRSGSSRGAVDRLLTMPIKGTRPAGEDVEGAKDAAEHVMIVDLERNDLARVCEPGSVRWPELMAQRRARRRDASRLDRRGPPARGRDARRDPGGDVPRRLGHGRAEDRRARPDRRARAGRPRRVDGRARTSGPTATSTSR